MSKNIFRIGFVWILLVSLSACAYSVSTLKRDDVLRHKILTECLKAGLSAKDDQNCINAGIAQAKVSGGAVKEFVEGLDLDL